MNLYSNQECQISSLSLTTDCLRFPAEKLAVICRKLLIMKSNWKYVPADGIVQAQNECEISKWFTYWGADKKKMWQASQKFSKKINNLKKCIVTPIFYVMKWKWQG